MSRKKYGLTLQQVCPICEGNGEVCVTCHRPHDACECPGADDLEPCVCSLPADEIRGKSHEGKETPFIQQT